MSNKIEVGMSYYTFDGYVVDIHDIEVVNESYALYTGNIALFGDSKFTYNPFGECLMVKPIGDRSEGIRNIQPSSFDIMIDPVQSNEPSESEVECEVECEACGDECCAAEEYAEAIPENTYVIKFVTEISLDANSIEEVLAFVTNELKDSIGSHEVLSVVKV